MGLQIVTLSKLNKNLTVVQRELSAFGVWDTRLEKIPVYLGWVGLALGYQYYGSSGAIVVPGLSVMRTAAALYGVRTSLLDVLRHEYGHAFAHSYPRLVRSKQFSQAFGAPHDSGTRAAYAVETHITEYAATNPCEDFAEMFMTYLRARGRLPKALQAPVLRKKWRFVHTVLRRAARGLSTWR